VISVSLLWFLLTRVGVSTLVNTAFEVRPIFYVASITLSAIGMMLSAWKWRVLLEIPGESISFLALWKYTYIGKFFNAFIPTSMGGDPVRIYYVYENFDTGMDAVTSVVADRVIGLFTILLASGIAAILAYNLLPLFITQTVIMISIGGMIFITAVFTFGPRFPLLESVLFRIERFSLGTRLEKLFRSLYSFQGDLRALGFAVALSILFRLVLILNNYLIARGLGIDVPFIYFILFIPVVELILSVPISIQGFGVREASYVYFFTLVGVPNEIAFVFGFVMQVMLELTTSAIGGVVYMMDRIVG
jgi:hypothetical protein